MERGVQSSITVGLAESDDDEAEVEPMETEVEEQDHGSLTKGTKRAMNVGKAAWKNVAAAQAWDPHLSFGAASH